MPLCPIERPVRNQEAYYSGKHHHIHCQKLGMRCSDEWWFVCLGLWSLSRPRSWCSSNPSKWNFWVSLSTKREFLEIRDMSASIKFWLHHIKEGHYLGSSNSSITPSTREEWLSNGHLEGWKNSCASRVPWRSDLNRHNQALSFFSFSFLSLVFFFVCKEPANYPLKWKTQKASYFDCNILG